MSEAAIASQSNPSERGATWLLPAIPPPGVTSRPHPPLEGVTGEATPNLTTASSSQAERRRKRSRPAQDRLPTPESVHVSIWHDDLVVDAVPATGFYAERYYGPIVGPTCLLIVRSLAARLRTDAKGFSAVTDEIAASIGCSSRAGASSQFWKALRRGVRFGLLRQVESRVFVRTELSPLTTRLVQQLPHHLRREHRLWHPIVDLDTEELFDGAVPIHPVDPLEALRQAALGRCTAEELLTLDRAQLLR